jgi:transcriptional regulator with XRE-family HTH domain
MARSVDVHVGQRIRQRRWILGISQTEIGDLVGIKFQQIQKYETGANRVSASRMWDIANALDVPVAFFFEGLVGPTTDTGAIEAASRPTRKPAISWGPTTRSRRPSADACSIWSAFLAKPPDLPYRRRHTFDTDSAHRIPLLTFTQFQGSVFLAGSKPGGSHVRHRLYPKSGWPYMSA